MSDILNNILEKFKKVDGGILDPQRSGADGQEDDFIGKHIDNIDTTESEPASHNKKHADSTKMYDRKKHRKGYVPKEDAEVYESADEGYDIENYYDELDEDLDIDMSMLKEDTLFFMQIIDEAVAEFVEEEADEEERLMIEEMLSTDEGYMELVDALFEGTDKCDDDDEDEEDDDDDEVIEKNPKLKKDTKMKEEIKRADAKMVKTKTPEGKVIFRKQKSNIKVD